MTTTLVAMDVSLGSPNTVAQVPTTVSDIGGYIAQAVTDTTTLATAITAAQTASGTANTDIGIVQTQGGTTQTAVGVVDTDIDTTVTDVATTLSDYDTAGADIVTALGTITYSATTHQFSGSFVSGPTPTAANCNAFITALNTMATALLAAQTAAVATQTASDTAVADMTTLVSDITTAVNASATSNTDVQALSTSAIATDLSNAQGNNLPSGVAIFIQCDNSKVTSLGAFSGALQSLLQFATSKGFF